MIRLVTALAAFWLWVSMPSVAAACPVCIPGDEESREAFIATTVLLSLLPPAMVGGLVWWIWRRSRAQQNERASELAPLSNAG